MAHDVFICHSAQDRIVANAACAQLEAHGIRCWIAPRDPIPGIPYGRQLVDAIAHGRVVVLIFSAHANASEAVLSELELAYKRGKNIIPFRIELVLPEGDLEYYIQRVHWLDAMSPPMEKRLDELVDLVRRVLDAAPGHAPAAAAPEVAASERAVIAAAPEPAPAVTRPAPEAPADPTRGLTVSAIAAMPVTANATMAFSYSVPRGGSAMEQVDFVDSHGNARPAVVRNRQRAGDEVSGEVTVPGDAQAGQAMRLRVATWDATGNLVAGLGPSFVVERAAAPSLLVPGRPAFIAAGVAAALVVAGAFALLHRPQPPVVATQRPPVGPPATPRFAATTAKVPARMGNAPPEWNSQFNAAGLYTKGGNCTSGTQSMRVYNDYSVPAYFSLAIQEHTAGERANYAAAVHLGRERVGSGATVTYSARVRTCKGYFYSWVQNVRFSPGDTGPVAIP